MFGALTVSNRSPWVCRWKAREFDGAATKFTGRGRRGSPMSVIVKPSLNMWPTKACHLWTMTCTPSPRPFCSVWPTNSILRAETGIMLPLLSPMFTSCGWWGDFVEREAARFGADPGDSNRSDRDDERDRREHRVEAVSLLDPQERRYREERRDPAGRLAQPEAGGAGVGREHLGDEHLRGIAGQLREEYHAKADPQHRRLASRIGPGQPEDAGQDEGDDGSGFAAEALQRIHHEGASTRKGEGDPEYRVQRLGDRKAALHENVRQPRAEPERDPEECGEADHAGCDPSRILAQHDAHRVTPGVARGVGAQRRERHGSQAHALQQVERPLALAVRR